MHANCTMHDTGCPTVEETSGLCSPLQCAAAAAACLRCAASPGSPPWWLQQAHKDTGLRQVSWGWWQRMNAGGSRRRRRAASGGACRRAGTAVGSLNLMDGAQAMIQSEAALARPLLQPQGLSFTLLAGAGPSLAPCFFLKG